MERSADDRGEPMVRPFLSVLGLLSVVCSVGLLAPCPTAEAAQGKRVSRVRIKKKEHVMQLLAGSSGNEEMVASYKVAIGPGGAGPKRREGDMVTPVGRYHITMHQPSQYKVFLRLDYPNVDDYRRFSSLKQSGELPKEAKIGGDVGIHGPPVSLAAEVKSSLKEHDWTAGCIAVNDDEISEVARLVRDGTPVDIED
jgi:murein L,D-transpeptidase YafK